MKNKSNSCRPFTFIHLDIFGNAPMNNCIEFFFIFSRRISSAWQGKVIASNWLTLVWLGALIRPRSCKFFLERPNSSPPKLSISSRSVLALICGRLESSATFCKHAFSHLIYSQWNIYPHLCNPYFKCTQNSSNFNSIKYRSYYYLL